MTRTYNLRECPNRGNHTEGPDGYIAHIEWSERQAETHEVLPCPGCGLWVLWVPKEPT